MNDSLLTKENIEFSNQLAMKFGRSIQGDLHEKCITMDDLQQESFLGLWEAAQRYDPALGVDFQTLAYIWCRKFVLRAVRKYSSPLSVSDNHDEAIDLLHFDVTAAFVTNTDSSDEDDGTLEDRLLYQLAIAEEADRAAEEEQQKRVERALDGLSRKERKALICLFDLDGQTETRDHNEVAQQLGIVPSRVTQIKERALRKLELLLSA